MLLLQVCPFWYRSIHHNRFPPPPGQIRPPMSNFPRHSLQGMWPVSCEMGCLCMCFSSTQPTSLHLRAGNASGPVWKAARMSGETICKLFTPLSSNTDQRSAWEDLILARGQTLTVSAMGVTDCLETTPSAMRMWPYGQSLNSIEIIVHDLLVIQLTGFVCY